MKLISLKLLIGCAAFFIVSCAQNNDVRPTDSDVYARSGNSGQGATQISGIGYFADEECDVAGEGADFALFMTGDLEGCWFVYVEEYDCSPSGTYRESGQEHFIGTYNGQEGSFWTSYKFEAKFEGCEDGFFVGAEIFGRCQHPIQKGSGEGVFEGVSGRLDFKDNVETGEFPYRGHLRY